MIIKTKNGLIGRSFDDYTLTSLLVAGSSTNVYMAEHIDPTETKRYSVFKYWHTKKLTNPVEREHFLQELQFRKSLRHPHLVPIFAFGIDKQQHPYLITEYIPLQSLHTRLQRWDSISLTREESISSILQIGEALNYLHEHNSIHGNLKPQNILFNLKGEALLSDARLASLSKYFASSYLAPEEQRGSISSQSDQYALACIAYKTFTLHEPPLFHKVASSSVTIAEVMTTLHELTPRLPTQLELALLRSLAQEPEQRNATMAPFLAALQAAPGAEPAPVPRLVSGPELVLQKVEVVNGEDVIHLASDDAFTTMTTTSTSLLHSLSIIPTQQTMPSSTQPLPSILSSIPPLSSSLLLPAASSSVSMDEDTIYNENTKHTWVSRYRVALVGLTCILLAGVFATIVLAALPRPTLKSAAKSAAGILQTTVQTTHTTLLTGVSQPTQGSPTTTASQFTTSTTGTVIAVATSTSSTTNGGTPTNSVTQSPIQATSSPEVISTAIPTATATTAIPTATTAIPTATATTVISASCVGNGVYIYQSVNYKGVCENFTSDTPDLTGTTIGNGTAASIKIVGDYTATLYVGSNYQGTSSVVKSSVPDLSRLAVGSNSVSSLKVVLH